MGFFLYQARDLILLSSKRMLGIRIDGLQSWYGESVRFVKARRG